MKMNILYILFSSSDFSLKMLLKYFPFLNYVKKKQCQLASFKAAVSQ